ncbi:ABC transporter ATP-binding protein [Minwuia thermotolerans]|uniref:ABC transporter n=1 Tax=Minwuia thermotolerans TaxID=2056226 RepID=A0A2M9FZW2_9PROT|nr:ATP-binding cassette domain-containing protein [Minwuia thermotolerans]PJK29008.1 ABC transporter [Minwuia thermotolerans]
MAESQITLKDVHVTLDGAAGPVRILRGIDLDIGAGETVAILGPSGSGKSTLLSIVGGLEAVTSGALSFRGRDLTGLNEDRLALFRRDHVSIVFQSFHLLPTMTALENVAAPLELAGRADPFGRAARELETVGLAERTGHYPSQLSGGEQQRVAVARALAADPEVILADEPTGNLDGETGGRIVDLLFRANSERDTTLLLVTHDEKLARRCGRILRLKDGVIASEEPGVERAA